ncbi:MAG: hypothetical protein ACHQ9S_18685 [Candidatus Binatia bacterium]
MLRPLRARAVLALIVTLCSTGCSRGCAAAASGPVAQILAPDSGSKLRKGQSAGVTIRVDGTPQVSWVLSLEGQSGPDVVLANGSGVVSTLTVAELNADTLVAGTSYSLDLTATDGGAIATAVATFTIPDPQYTLIPPMEGDLSRLVSDTYAVDSSGDEILYSSATGSPAPITVIHRHTGQRNLLSLSLDNSSGPKFSGDGTRLFYTGFFHQGGFVVDGLGYRDLGSGADVLLVDQATSTFFTVDDTGQRVALQLGGYLLYDQTTNATRQLTTDPAAIDWNSNCPQQFGTIPLISADGGTVVMITSATLGIVPADPAVGCRVFSYDVATQSLKQVAALPQSVAKIDIPVLSADGRWLSFVFSQALPSGGSHGAAALIDLQTGTLSAPVIDAGNFTTFDSAVTRDGTGIIISTEADLDPRVGNADHNLELFYYDRATGQFTQISETLLGIGRTPNGCESYIPSIDHDGGVAVFSFKLFSVEGCYVDGPQQNEADGLVFGAFVRAVRKRPGNNGPVFPALPDQRVVAGQTLTLNLAAQDPDGDPISFFAQETGGLDVFPGSTITDHHDGTATFQWPTGPQDVGDHVLRVAAFDEGGGEVFHDVTISIVPGGAPCTGDCNGDGQVTVDEVLEGVDMALGNAPATACLAYDAPVTIDQVLAAVNNAVDGCPATSAGG